MSFKLPNLTNLGKMAISIPQDESGSVGRECPQIECEGYFKIRLGTGLTGTDLLCHCPYCGHTGSQNTFLTKEQVAYVHSVAKRRISDALRKDLDSLQIEHKPTGPFGLGFSIKFKVGSLIPIKYYRERSLETQIRCSSCALEYSVFGVFAFCPDCGVHNSLQTLEKNAELVRKQLTLASEVSDPDLSQHLIDDALENCVSALDGFGRECCRIRAHLSTSPEKSQNVSFQNLNGAAKSLKALFDIALTSTVSVDEWQTAHIAFMRRHLLTHRSGVVDQKYLDETGESAALLGRRLIVKPADVERVAEIVVKLGRGLTVTLPPVQ